MLTRLSKVLIGGLGVIVIGGAIVYEVNINTLQQKEINLLSKPTQAVVQVATPSATQAPTATPSASTVRSFYTVKPTVPTK